MAIELLHGQGVQGQVGWTLPFGQVEVNHGVHPSIVPHEMWSVGTGKDSRVKGAARKALGFRKWADLQVHSGTWLDEIIEDGASSDRDWRDATFHEFWAFTISVTNGEGNVYGFIGWNRQSKKCYVVSKCDLLNRPVGSNTATASTGEQDLNDWVNRPGVTVVQDHFNSSGTDVTWETPPQITVTNRFIYISNRDNSENITLWFDWDRHSLGGNNGQPNDNGWVADYFGIPPMDDLNLWNSIAPTASTGFMIEGEYAAQVRLIDIERSRVTNPAHTVRVTTTGTGDTTDAVGSDSILVGRIPYLHDAADDGNRWSSIVRDGGASAPAWASDTGLAGGTSEIGQRWGQIQLLMSLSTLDKSVVAGPDFYVADQWEVHTAWKNTPTTEFLITNWTAFADAVRSIDTSGATSNELPLTDVGLAQNPEWNIGEDLYWAWSQGNLRVIEGMGHYQGMTYYAVVDSKTNWLRIFYSDPRDFLPENFQIGAEFLTEYRAKGEHDSTLNDRTATTVAFLGAADYMYILGDGPIYRSRRDGPWVDFIKVHDSLPLLNRHSACTFGTGIFMLCEGGAYLLDGATSGVTKVDAIERLIRDRWSAPEVRRWLQVAFDATMDCIYILNPCHAELVELNIATNAVTMYDGAYFSFVRSTKLRTQSGLAERAMFFNYHGIVCVPQFERDDDIRQYTMHGQSDRDIDSDGLTAPDYWNFYVSAVSETTSSHGSRNVTRLTLTDPNSTATAIQAPSHMLNGGTVAALDGAAAGKLFVCWGKPLGLSGGSYTWNDATNTVDVLGHSLGIAVGDHIAVGPVPLVLVGGPLPGTSKTRFLQRKHVDSSTCVLSNIRSSTGETARASNFPTIKAGICGVSALLGNEPLSVPDKSTAFDNFDTGGRIEFHPAEGALPRWVDLTDSTVYLPTGILGYPDELTPEQATNGISPPDGVAGGTLFPLIVSDVSNVLFDLLEARYRGTIHRSEQSDLTGA